MTQVRTSIDIDATVTAAYNQWAQFDSYPSFMEGIVRVIEVDEETVRWTARVAGRETSWLARITRQVPEQVISWVAVEGPRNDGTVVFEPLGPNWTRVSVRLDMESDGELEETGDATALKERVTRELERFREIVEARH